VGKTRLVEALVDETRPPSLVHLHGSPFHLEAGFHPVRRLFEARCGIGDDAHAAERLECLVTELESVGLDMSETNLLAPVMEIEPSAGYDPAATEGRKLEEQVAEAVRAYVVACTGEQPAILVAEDLHWFDAATRALLGDLLRSGPGRLLVVGTSRDAEPGAWESIELRPLSQAASFALIDALEHGLSERERDVLTTRSGGVPLYLEELVQAGATHRSAWTRETAPVPGSVPEVLYEPLVARLYATPAALPVAATAAAAGQEVDRSLLAATMSVPAEELSLPIRALVDAQVIEPVEDRPGRYRFRHELLRDVAYELQPPSWRRKVHDRLCDILAADEPSDWHVLASHFERAERYSEAAAAYQQTAEGARRRGALDEARAHLTRAIDLVMPLTGRLARDHREVELRLRRGFLAMSAEGAGSAEASADFDRCLELAAADPEGDDMFSTLISVWAYDLSRAELERARQVSATLRAALAGKRDVFRPQNLAGFGMLDWFGGSFTSALRALAAAIDDLAEIGGEDDVAAAWFVPNDPTVAMHVHLALARFMAGDEAGAEESLARAATGAASLEFPQGPWSAAYSNWMGSWMWIEAGRLDRADEAVADLLASSDRHGFDNWALIATTQSAVLDGMKALRSGTADADTLADHADAVDAYVELWEAMELRIFLPFYVTTAGALLAAAGDAAGAREHYEESLQLAAQTGMRFYDAETARRMAHLSPDRGTVLTQLRAALDVARGQGARPFELRIERDLNTA
jgi:hypothetical protein